MTIRKLLPLLLIPLAILGLIYGVLGPGFRPPVRRMACTLSEGGVLPDGPSVFPPVRDDEWTLGPKEALVTLIAYSDLQCRRCGELAAALWELRSAYPDDLRVVFRSFPLDTVYDKSGLAARAIEAAGAQGQFWPLHDRLFQQQDVWVDARPELFRLWLIEQARDLGLDPDRFAAALDGETTLAAVERAYGEAVELGLTATPSLVINGQYYEGPIDAWTLGAYIELIKLEARQFDACPSQEIDARTQITATLHTTQGDIVIRLSPEQAPLAVNNFVFLARQGWYDGVPFHRVIPGYIMQTGDPSGTGLGGPGYTFADEIVATARFDRPGVVGMASSGPGENGSQFFITYAEQPGLDGHYTIFGQVVSGMDAAAALTVRDPAADSTGLPPADEILSVEIVEQ